MPVEVVARHFRDTDGLLDLILAVDIGPEPIKKARWLRFLWHVFCGGTCETDIDAVHPQEREGLVLVRPQIDGFHALQFKLSRHQKWHAITAGFIAASKAITNNELVVQDAANRLNAMAIELSRLNMQRHNRKAFTSQVEAYLRDNGFF